MKLSHYCSAQTEFGSALFLFLEALNQVSFLLTPHDLLNFEIAVA